MLQYREFLDLTDDEVEFILTDMFAPVDVISITREKKWNEIKAEIVTGNFSADGKPAKLLLVLTKPSHISDGITRLTDDLNDKSVWFDLSPQNSLKWKQYLLAKGCDYRLKDNPYMKEGE